MTQSQDALLTPDGLRLRFYRRLPEGEDPRAAAIVLHGLAEHAGRYGELTGALAARGSAVYAVDHRGHGQSEGPRVFVRSLDVYCDDLGLVLDRVRAEQPGRPVFLFGHSMGGAVAASFCIARQPNLRGLILSAPPFRVGRDVHPWLRPLAGLFGRFLPRLRIIRLGASMLSRDEAVVEHFKRDPLVFHGRLPCRTAAEILKAGPRILAGAAELRMPLLVLHGTGDRLTEAGASRELFGRASSPDKTLKLYDGLWHDLAHEPEKEQVLGDVAEWVAARMA